MLRKLKNDKAQAVAGEYVLVFFLVVGMISGMTLYFRRTVQARMRDARYSMMNIVRQRAGTPTVRANFVGVLYRAYEPYYANTASIAVRDLQETTTILPGGSTGIFRKDYGGYSRVTTNSFTLPPMNAY